MLRRALILSAVICGLLAGPAAADSVTRNSAGVVNVDARTTGDVVVTRSGADLFFSNFLTSQFETSPPCSVADMFGNIRCPSDGTSRIEIVASPENNLLILAQLTIPVVWHGGDGDDTGNQNDNDSTGRLELHGEDGDDILLSGDGTDVINGGPGADTLVYGPGDEFIGGPDSDSLDATTVAGALHLSLDDAANDGLGGPGTGNIHSDIEELRLSGGADVVTGSPGPDTIRAGNGGDSIDAGGGFDFVDGEGGNDSIAARDGLAERVDCGPGNDTAIVDDLDVHVACENVSISADVRPDVDADGARKPGDCNDNNPAIRPGAADVPENGVDEDCDGADAVVLDRDGDGVPRPIDCDDTRTDVRPGAREVLGNKVDENCNGEAEPFPTLAVRLSQRTLAFRTFTTIETLRLSRVRRGQKVRLRCSGRGCPFKSRRIGVKKRGKLNIVGPVGRARLRGGAKLTIRVTSRNGVAKQFAFTFRRGAAPIFLIRCAAPGTGLRRC